MFYQILSIIPHNGSDHSNAVMTTFSIFATMLAIFFLSLFAKSLYTRRQSIFRFLRRVWQMLVDGTSWVLHLNRHQQQQQRIYLLHQPSSSSSGSSLILSLESTRSSSSHQAEHDSDSARGSEEAIPLRGPFPMPFPFTSPQYFYDGDCFVGLAEPSHEEAREGSN